VPDQTSPLVDALIDILEDERRALRAGELDRLLRLAELKESTLARLRTSRLPAPVLQRLREGCERNRALLVAAADGIRSAGLRLRQVAQGPSDLFTYDGAGRRRNLDPLSASVVRKA